MPCEKIFFSNFVGGFPSAFCIIILYDYISVKGLIMLKIKKSTVFSLLTAAIILLAGCQKKNTTPEGLDENHNLLPVTSINYEGMYYIRSADGKSFYPLSSKCIMGEGKNIYMWFTDGYESYIPEYTEGCSLVYVNKTARPSLTNIYEMDDTGYTIGAQFEPFDELGETCVRFTEVTCPYSPVTARLGRAIASPKATKVTEINDTTFKRTMIDSYGFIHGLEANCMYKLSFYEGTVYKSVDVMADTRLFLIKNEYASAKYIPHKNIYYEVVFPEGLPNGYYIVPGFGMFHYNVDSNIILPDISIPEVTAENGEDTQETVPAEGNPEETTSITES